MKKTFKKYKLGEIQKVKLSKKNKKLIDKFLLYCSTTAGKSKLQNIERVMIKVCDIWEIDLDKITLTKLRELLSLLKTSDLMPPTKNEVKKHLKRFIKEFYPDWSIKFKGLKDIRLEKDENQEKINHNTILRRPDITRLMKGTSDLMMKCLIIIFWETAGRVGEILSIIWKDIDFEKKTIKLYSTKTKNVRVLPVDESIKHLRRYKEECKEFPKADEFIFPSPKLEDRHFSNAMLDTFIRRLGQKVLGKAVWPYLIRHSRLTELQKTLPPKPYEKFSDHSLKMASRYSHLDSEDLRKIFNEKIYKIEELSPDETKKLEYIKEMVEEIHGAFKGKEKMKISNGKEEIEIFKEGWEELKRNL